MALKRIVLGAAIGYVLGARAGRGRFEQIKEGWQKFREWEPAQAALTEVQEIGRSRMQELRRRARGLEGDEDQRDSDDRAELERGDAEDRSENEHPDRDRGSAEEADLEDQDEEESEPHKDEGPGYEVRREEPRGGDSPHEEEPEAEEGRREEPDESGRRSIGERVGALARAALERGRVG
jgi:hypothetical protein